MGKAKKKPSEEVLEAAKAGPNPPTEQMAADFPKLVAAITERAEAEGAVISDVKPPVETPTASPLGGAQEPAGELQLTKPVDEPQPPEASPEASGGDLKGMLKIEGVETIDGTIAAEAASSVSETDDTRAPLSTAVKPKEPKKPLIKWDVVIGNAKAFGSKVWEGTKRGFDIGGGFVLAVIIIALWAVAHTLPAIMYVMGWVSRALYNSAKTGWNHEPPFDDGLSKALDKVIK